MIILRYLFIFFILIFLQSLTVNFLPTPFNLLNSLILVFIIKVYLNRKVNISVFLSFAFLLDIFSLSFFGVNLLSFFITWIMMNWLMSNYLSNYHFYTVFLSSLLASFLFRFFSIGLIFMYNFFTIGKILITTQLFLNLLLEGLITASVSVIVYLIFFKLLKAINPSYIFFRR